MLFCYVKTVLCMLKLNEQLTSAVANLHRAELRQSEQVLGTLLHQLK